MNSARHFAAAVVTILFTGASASGWQWLEEDCVDLLDVEGSQDGNLFGDRVAEVGDVTGDGVPDFAVSAPFFNTNRGRVSVHSGVDGDEVWGQTTAITSTILGFALAVSGDLDGDGAREVIASAPFATNTGGFVFVYSGDDGSVMHTFQGDPVGFNASIGYGIATGGDYNGDGIEDIAIGDGGNDDVGPNAGRVSVYSSADFSLIGHLHPPQAPAARFGTGIAFLGDVNDDGNDDLVIADRFESNEEPGRLHVFSYAGSSPELLYTIEPVSLGCVLCGDSVGGGRDVNGDGIGDIVIGEAFPEFRARVFSGLDGAPLLTIDDPLVQTAELVDDVDGDGRADVLAGDRSNDEGAEDAGRVYLFSGCSGRLLRTMTSTVAGTSFGTRGTGFSDIDGDGFAEILIGARSGFGHAFVMAGVDLAASADVNGDEVVNTIDLLMVLGAWGPCKSCPEDLDGDGI
jgi:hypothetical protein